MAETKFSGEQVDQFIDLYRSFECLWDVKSKDYRDINKRNNAYETIADIMNITVEQVKKKINNMRSTYLQEKKKVELSKPTGTGTDDIYTPSLSWFNSMSFLDDVTTSRKTTSTPITGKCGKKTGNTEHNTTSVQESPRSINQQFPRTKRARTQEINANKELEDAVNTLSAICKEDSTEFDKFGESIVPQLKQFPLEDALQMQLEIQQLITHKRLRLLHQRTLSSVNSSNRTVTPGPSSPFSPGEYSVPTPTSIHSYESINSDTFIEPYTEENNPIFVAMNSANIVEDYL